MGVGSSSSGDGVSSASSSGSLSSGMSRISGVWDASGSSLVFREVSPGVFFFLEGVIGLFTRWIVYMLGGNSRSIGSRCELRKLSGGLTDLGLGCEQRDCFDRG